MSSSHKSERLLTIQLYSYHRQELASFSRTLIICKGDLVNVKVKLSLQHLDEWTLLFPLNSLTLSLLTLSLSRSHAVPSHSLSLSLSLSLSHFYSLSVFITSYLFSSLSL